MLISVGSILLCWMLAGTTVLGWGMWVGRLTPLRGIELSIARAAWIGLLACIVLLQLAHFFVPIDRAAAGALFIGGLGGLCINHSILSTRLRDRPVTASQWILVSLAAIWLAYLSSVPRSDTDTLLYHFQSVRWTQAYPVVIGLGNLHGRLAFNSAADLVFAALAVGPWRGNPMAVGNGFLLLLLVANAARYLGPPAKQTGASWRAMQWFWIAFLPALAAWAYVMPGTLRTDLAPFALLAVAMSYAMEFLLAIPPAESSVGALATIGSLAIGAIVMKLSSIACAVAMLSICLYSAAPWQRRRLCAVLSIAAVLLLTPWLAHSVMMSGCLIYPVVATRLPVPWAVPAEMVKWEAYAIHTWALWDNWSPAGAEGGKEFSVMWMKHFLRAMTYEYGAALLPAAIGCALWMSARRGNSSRRARALLLPIVAGIGFWFLMAPTVRFLGPVVWLFAATGAAAFASARPKAYTKTLLAAMIALSFLIGMGTGWTLFRGDWRRGEQLRILADHLFPHENEASASTNPAMLPVRQLPTLSGLVINVPVDPNATVSPPLKLQPYTHGNVGDAPLPASPYVHPKLRLRTPGDLSRGFQIDP